MDLQGCTRHWEAGIVVAGLVMFAMGCGEARPGWEQQLRAGLEEKCDWGGDRLHLDDVPDLLVGKTFPIFATGEPERTEVGCVSTTADVRLADLAPVGLLPRVAGDEDRWIAMATLNELATIGWIRILEGDLVRPEWVAVRWDEVPAAAFESVGSGLPDLRIAPPSPHDSVGDTCQTPGSFLTFFSNWDITISNAGPGSVVGGLAVRAEGELHAVLFRRPMVAGESVYIERIGGRDPATVTVDPNDEIDEANESNNEVRTAAGQELICR